MSGRRFPRLPNFQATWAPLQMEPIPGSSERITIAIAAIGSDGSQRVVPVIDEESLECFLGSDADGMSRVVSVCQRSLQGYLENNGDLSNWRAPINGVDLGERVQAHAPDMESLLAMATQDSAFLGTYPASGPVEQPKEVIQPAEGNRWPSLVRNAVKDRKPELDKFFGRKVKVAEKARETTIDYAGERLVANLGRLVPGSRLSNDVRVAKSKLWELAEIRSYSKGGHLDTNIQSYELLVYRPEDSNPAFTEKQIDRMHEALNELVWSGDQYEMRVRHVTQTDKAADRIIEAEGAA